MNILAFNLLLSSWVFWVAAKLYVVPRLHQLQPSRDWKDEAKLAQSVAL